MQAAYVGQSDVDAGLSDVTPCMQTCMQGVTSIVKYAVNQRAHSRRILPSSFFCLYSPPCSFNQSNGQRVVIYEAN